VKARQCSTCRWACHHHAGNRSLGPAPFERKEKMTMMALTQNKDLQRSWFIRVPQPCHIGIKRHLIPIASSAARPTYQKQESYHHCRPQADCVGGIPALLSALKIRPPWTAIPQMPESLSGKASERRKKIPTIVNSAASANSAAVVSMMMLTRRGIGGARDFSKEGSTLSANVIGACAAR
jgi:hypothetical protein